MSPANTDEGNRSRDAAIVYAGIRFFSDFPMFTKLPSVVSDPFLSTDKYYEPYNGSHIFIYRKLSVVSRHLGAN